MKNDILMMFVEEENVRKRKKESLTRKRGGSLNSNR